MEYLTAKGKQCTVSVIEASISQVTQQKLLTFALTYPRFIHAELMTHRDFSRNAQSTRAFPTAKLIERVRTQPVFFTQVGKNQSGMQAAKEVSADIRSKFADEWKQLANITADFAERWSCEYGIHKQVAGRVLEPYSTITVLVTATKRDNWYALRAHADAQPEIQDLAYTMLALENSGLINYRTVHKGPYTDPRTWHLPFVSMDERTSNPITSLLAMSAARSARVSYLTHDRENPSLDKDMDTYRKLVGSEPLHASPLEHQAYNSGEERSSRNFTGGWVQHRVFLESAKSVDALFDALGTL